MRLKGKKVHICTVFFPLYIFFPPFLCILHLIRLSYVLLISFFVIKKKRKESGSVYFWSRHVQSQWIYCQRNENGERYEVRVGRYVCKKCCWVKIKHHSHFFVAVAVALCLKITTAPFFVYEGIKSINIWCVYARIGTSTFYSIYSHTSLYLHNKRFFFSSFYLSPLVWSTTDIIIRLLYSTKTCLALTCADGVVVSRNNKIDQKFAKKCFLLKCKYFYVDLIKTMTVPQLWPQKNKNIFFN